VNDKINPQRIAADTGLDVEDVNKVLAHLIPSWLFSRYVDNDLDATDYYDIRQGRERDGR
jgi:hypothetical protein